MALSVHPSNERQKTPASPSRAAMQPPSAKTKVTSLMPVVPEDVAPALSGQLFQEALGYQLDTWQPSILFPYTLRQRANVRLSHTRRTSD